MTNCNGCVNLKVNAFTNVHYCKLGNALDRIQSDNKIDMMPNGVAKLNVVKLVSEKDCNTYESDWNK